MSEFGNLEEKAKDLAGEHPEQIDKGIEKAGDEVDERTGDKYSKQVDTGQEKATDYVEGLGGKEGGNQSGS